MAMDRSLFRPFRTLGMGRSAAILLACIVAGAGNATTDTFEDAVRAYDREDMQRAFAIFERLTRQGHADAQYSLGVIYLMDTWLSEDAVCAYDLFAAAAGKGHRWARLMKIVAAMFASCES